MSVLDICVIARVRIVGHLCNCICKIDGYIFLVIECFCMRY